MKKNYRFLCKLLYVTFIVLICSILYASYLNVILSNASNHYKVGDYIQFGRYNEVPILWQVITIEDQNPVLLSNKILAFKAFSSTGDDNNHAGSKPDAERNTHGTNNWLDSTLRVWLNSNSNPGEVFNQYLYNSPTIDRVFHNPYDQKGGFLSNFTTHEQSLIAKRKHFIPLSRHDNVDLVSKRGDQSEKQTFKMVINPIITDQVFLLSAKEFANYISPNDTLNNVTSTLEAINNSIHTEIIFSKSDYWTLSPSTDTSSRVLYASNKHLHCSSASGIKGVRPALSLLSTARHSSGDGTKYNPYIISEQIDMSNKSSEESKTPEITVKLNEKSISFDQAPVIKNGRTLVPIRAVLESLGATVDWIEETRTVITTKGNVTISLQIDSTLAKVDEQKVVLDVPATIVGNRTLIPLRFISESFGLEVGWNEASRQISLITSMTTKSETVVFEDENLEKAVRNALHKPIGEITYEDVYTVTYLNTYDITDISQLRHFKNLVTLILHGDNLTDIGELSSLASLEQLTILSNQLKDITPLSYLDNLTFLQISSSNISNTILPDYIPQLKKPTSVGGKIEDISPLQNLKHLKSLLIASDQVSDISPLAELKNLDTLLICGKNITDISPLKELTSLNMLSISSDNLESLSPLAYLTNLKILTFGGNKFFLAENYFSHDITDINNLDFSTGRISDISALKNLTNLELLAIVGDNITDISPVSNLTNLNLLLINSNNIKDISPIKHLKNLSILTINSSSIKDISSLEYLTNLNDLTLNGDNIDDISSLKKLTNLTNIVLSGDKITDITPLADLKNLNLLKLHLSNVTDSSILQEYQSRNIIKYLNDYKAPDTSETDTSETDTKKIEQVRVSTVDDFLREIDSNKHIVLEPGIYNLTLAEMKYDDNPRINWKPLSTGYDLFLTNISNLIIEGSKEGKVELIIESPLSHVLSFENVTNVKLQNILVRHANKDYRHVGLLFFKDSLDIFVNNVQLHGGGAEGIHLINVGNFEMINSIISKCNNYIMTIVNSDNVSFNNCTFTENGFYWLDLIRIKNSFNIKFDTCIISNSGMLMNQEPPRLGNVTFHLFRIDFSHDITVANSSIFGITATYLMSKKNAIPFENTNIENNSFKE